MKIRYFKSMTARRKQRRMKKAASRREYRERIAKWHEKFAWLPLKISTPDDDREHSTIVLFETVIQKGRVTNDFGMGEDMPRFDKTTWIRYPEKEYFKKKLDGTLEEEEQFGDFIHDGTNISFQGSGAAGVSKGSPINKSRRPSAGPPK